MADGHSELAFGEDGAAKRLSKPVRSPQDALWIYLLEDGVVGASADGGPVVYGKTVEEATELAFDAKNRSVSGSRLGGLRQTLWGDWQWRPW